MDSLIRRIIGAVAQIAVDFFAADATKTTSADHTRPDTSTHRQRTNGAPDSHAHPQSPSPTARRKSKSHHDSSRYRDPATSNRPETSIREASVSDALAHASYTPVMDGDADPGEVVWTWVPYQEDPNVGKDRPAVVIGAHGDGVYLLQLTSKDHTRDAAQEAAAGRYWFDIGAGEWDSRGRPSEVRLDRALWVKATDVRREGSILPKATWEQIVEALTRYHREHGN